MKNKKAWLRIVEAFLAVLIITSVLLTVIVNQPRESQSEEIHNMQRLILQQIALDDSLRADVLIGEETNIKNIKDFVNGMKPALWNFEIEICKIEDACGMTVFPEEAVGKEIYAEEILISSTPEKYDSDSIKKLKLFVWIK